MNKMIVIFENLEPVHLQKDVGMLPLMLKRNGTCEVSLLSTLKKFKNAEYEQDIKLKFFNKFKSRKLNKLFLFLNVLINVRKINYLMVFHGGKNKLLLFILCKIINPSLITYVKLDMGELGAYESIQNSKRVSFLKKAYRKLYNRYIDIFTVETKKVYESIKELPIFKNKIHYLANGFYAETSYDFSMKKEKIIVTVGRIGTPQKNNELLLDAISKLDDLGEYKFYFIGPINDEFEVKVQNLKISHPELENKIIITGNITNKKELYEFYKKAEVLCFTSLYESFGLVMLEALYFGCYLISTDLAGAYDLTGNGKNGTILKINEEKIDELFKKYVAQSEIKGMQEFIDYQFNNILESQWFEKSSDKLASELKNIINGEINITIPSKELSSTVYNEFNWIHLANNLTQIFEETMRRK